MKPTAVTIKDDFLVLDPLNPAPLVTLVEYRSGAPDEMIMLWEQVTGAGAPTPPRWDRTAGTALKHRLAASRGFDPVKGLGPDWEREGAVDSPELRPGQVYWVFGTIDRTFDPNTDPMPDDPGIAVAIATRDRSNLFEPDAFTATAGGTQVDLANGRTRRPTSWIAEIGDPRTLQQHPVSGFHYFPTPVARIIDGRLAPVHQGRLRSTTDERSLGVSLHPGEEYAWLVRVADDQGNWDEGPKNANLEFRVGAVTMLTKEVTIDIDTVTVLHCGDVTTGDNLWIVGVYTGSQALGGVQWPKRWKTGDAENTVAARSGAVYGVPPHLFRADGPPHRFTMSLRGGSYPIFGIHIDIVDLDVSGDEESSGYWEIDGDDGRMFAEAAGWTFEAVSQEKGVGVVGPHYVQAKVNGRISIDHV